MMRTVRVSSIGLGAVLALVLAAGCGIDLRADEVTLREEQLFRVDTSSPVQVDLTTFDGDVEVRAWDRAEVSVSVERRGATKAVVEAIQVRMAQDGNRVTVEALSPEASDWLAGLIGDTSHSARVVATVPRACELRVRSGDGSVKLEGVTGKVDVDTGDGSVRGTALAGDLRVRTGDGSIRLETIEGNVTAGTGDGSIVLSGRLSGLSATTGDGTIAISLEPGSRPERDWDVSTEDGGISIEVPEGFAAEVEATTHDGVVRADEGLGLPGQKTPGIAVRGRIGVGGKTLKIRSGDGSISLRRS